MAFVWIDPTTSLGSQVRNAKEVGANEPLLDAIVFMLGEDFPLSNATGE